MGSEKLHTGLTSIDNLNIQCVYFSACPYKGRQCVIMCLTNTVVLYFHCGIKKVFSLAEHKKIN